MPYASWSSPSSPSLPNELLAPKKRRDPTKTTRRRYWNFSPLCFACSKEIKCTLLYIKPEEIPTLQVSGVSC